MPLRMIIHDKAKSDICLETQVSNQNCQAGELGEAQTVLAHVPVEAK